MTNRENVTEIFFLEEIPSAELKPLCKMFFFTNTSPQFYCLTLFPSSLFRSHDLPIYIKKITEENIKSFVKVLEHVRK